MPGPRSLGPQSSPETAQVPVSTVDAAGRRRAWRAPWVDHGGRARVAGVRKSLRRGHFLLKPALAVVAYPFRQRRPQRSAASPSAGGRAGCPLAAPIGQS